MVVDTIMEVITVAAIITTMDEDIMVVIIIIADIDIIMEIAIELQMVDMGTTIVEAIILSPHIIKADVITADISSRKLKLV